MKSFGEFSHDLQEKNVPDNPALWKKAIAKAKAKFDVYPSAYANAWASKWYKGEGGTWSVQKEETDLEESTPEYRKMLKDYEKSDDKKVFDILDKNGYRMGEQSDTLVRNMLKKFKGNVKKAAAEIMKKYPGMKKEGFASDAQRRAAFASGYKAKGKKGKKNEALMDQEREDKPLIKWFDEFEKLLKKAGGKYKDIDPTDMLKLYYQGKNPKAAIKELL